MGPGLKVGSRVYRDPNNSLTGQCLQCLRYALQVSRTPPIPPPPEPKGFWKIPTD